MKFAFILGGEGQLRHRVARLCRQLLVSTSWLLRVDRAPAERARRRGREAESARPRSAPRGPDLLRQSSGPPGAEEAGRPVSRKRVVRLMQEEGLVGRHAATVQAHHRQRSRPASGDQSARSRVHGGKRANQRWVGDTTELLMPTGKLYLAVIIDLFSRFVVGWALSAVNDRHLTIRALDMALRRRCPGAGLLHHSDQGSTYASEDYQASARRARASPAA